MTQEIKLPDPDTHCWDDEAKSLRDVWSYSPALVRKIIEADRAQRGEPVAWRWENKNVKGNWYLSWSKPDARFNQRALYEHPQPAHTEADVQEVLGSALREFGVFEQTVRSILNVEKK